MASQSLFHPFSSQVTREQSSSIPSYTVLHWQFWPPLGFQNLFFLFPSLPVSFFLVSFHSARITSTNCHRLTELWNLRECGIQPPLCTDEGNKVQRNCDLLKVTETVAKPGLEPKTKSRTKTLTSSSMYSTGVIFSIPFPSENGIQTLKPPWALISQSHLTWF